MDLHLRYGPEPGPHDPAVITGASHVPAIGEEIQLNRRRYRVTKVISVNGFRKLTPWGSGKFDPPGGRLVAVRAVFLGEKLASLAGAVGIAGQGQDLGVVDESVDHGGGDYVVGEGLSPAAEGQVRGDQY